MSEELKARVLAAAKREKRPMANWCAFHLERILDEMDAAAVAAAKTDTIPAYGLSSMESPEIPKAEKQG